MGTKNNPAPCDCYAKAEPDEPLFVLLARDRHAPTLVWLWATLRELDREDPAVVREARDCVEEMILWANKNGRKSVGVAQAVIAGVLELIRAANFSVKHLVEHKNDATGEDVVRAALTDTKFEEEPKLTERPALKEICEAFGWQGGTVHQVIEEIRRLRWIAGSMDGPGLQAVVAERVRQIIVKGYGDAHDDEHKSDEIAALAAFYAMPPAAREWPATETGYGDTFGEALTPDGWGTKTGARRKELVKAGALILAEIDRLDRAARSGGSA